MQSVFEPGRYRLQTRNGFAEVFFFEGLRKAYAGSLSIGGDRIAEIEMGPQIEGFFLTITANTKIESMRLVHKTEDVQYAWQLQHEPYMNERVLYMLRADGRCITTTVKVEEGVE